MRRASRIDDSHLPIVETLRKAGAGVQNLIRVGDGCPDLLVSYRGSWFLIECKNPLGPKGGQSRSQLGTLQRQWISAHRAPVHVCRTPDEALFAIGARRKTFHVEHSVSRSDW